MIVDYNKAVDDGRFLFLRSPHHRNYTREEYQAYLIYPCKTNCIRLYYREKRPIGLVTWCWFEEDKAKGFLNFEYLPTVEDYQFREDAQLWCVELIAPYGDGSTIFREARKECRSLYGPGTEVRWRRDYDPFKEHRKKM